MLAAVESLRESLKANPDNVESLYELSWIQATTTDPQLRNAREAVGHATRLVNITNYKLRAVRDKGLSKAFRIQAIYMAALAYAADGNYHEAMPHAQLAVQTAARMNEVNPTKVSAELVKASVSAEAMIRRNSPRAAFEALSEVGLSCEGGGVFLNSGKPLDPAGGAIRLDVPVHN